MKLRRFLYIVLSVFIICSIVEPAISVNARSKSHSSQSSGKKNRKNRNKKRSSGNSNSKKYKTNSKKTKNRGASGNSYSAPRETPSNDSLTLAVNEAVIADIPANQNPGGLRVNSVKTDRNSRIARLSLNENFTYLPVTQDLIRHISNSASKALPDSIRDYTVSLNVGNRNLAYYISKIDKLPEAHRTNTPFVVAASPLCNPKDGMEGDIVALWHSHGRYFRPGSGAWSWQRGFLFQSLEDTFTMSFILPYVVPMLENAGAYVMLPRERCLNRNEVIVDNDTYEGGVIYSQPYYKEMTGIAGWTTGDGEGFIYDLPDFRDTENPFENGTYRQTTTVKGGRPSVAAWYADIPEDGEYAVYVSYKTLPNSTTDAHYTVNYSGGSREFRVNQTMGGSTWVYLGSFPFKAGYSDSEPTITLSNLSEKEAGKILTADAVKIGGGMGNIARSNKRADIYYDPSTPEVAQDSPADSTESDDGDTDESGDDESSDESNDDESPDGDEQGQEQATIQTAPTVRKGPAPVFRTSGLPRYLEGARYWLQWAGIPESIYSPYHGSDDYKDDYTDRGMWVNYLAGGSRVLPDREGLNIPVDVSVALHSDAGKRSDDSYVGTLGIYYTNGGASYVDGTPRMNSRMLTDLIMRQITGDIRQTYEPNWTRRSMWDKSYLEARVAEVPTALIELLSHQNFGDMKYGLDPNFKFTVGRAIYKAIGRFISERKDRKFVVQPLPVKDFAIRRQKKGHYRLSWAPTPDPLESTAIPAAYIILERTGDELGFHKIGETHNSHFDFRTDDNLIHSFRIIAKNSGGLSFPSETLAMRESTNDSKPVLIINGFDRISAPAFFSEDGRAGFDSKNDFGVPYIYDASFTGFQTEYRRGAGDGFGRSASNYVGKIIPGNTFDFPYLHGLSIMASGRGFVSCSATAVEAGDVKLDNYKIIDYILGKQKMTVIGNGKSGVRFPTFSPKMQNLLTQFTDNGGRLLVSGAYVVSDLFDPRAGEEGQIFAEDILGISPASDAQRPESGKLTTVGGAGGSSIPMMNFEYSKDINEKRYHVENPDVLTPSEGTDAVVMMTFSDTGGAAGILTKRDKTRGVVLSIPLESIPNEETRNSLFSSLLEYLEK